MNTLRELRETRVLFHVIRRFIRRRSFVSFQLPASAAKAMRAQNFNYLRKISIDPWREIERASMKYGRKKKIRTVCRGEVKGGGEKSTRER